MTQLSGLVWFIFMLVPLFLTSDLHIAVPLEPSYQATWDANPEEMRVAVETGIMPEPDAG